MNEMPTVMNCSLTSNAYNFEPLTGGITASPPILEYRTTAQLEELQRQMRYADSKTKIKKEKDMSDKRRIVKVYIVDPDPNLPIEQALIHQSEEKFTELTDQELFFGLNINPLLEKHNDQRRKTVNKNATARGDKEIFLEPVRIRDLKMVVVDVATF